MFGKRKKKNTVDTPSRRPSKNIARRIREIFMGSSTDLEEFYENLEDLLVESDFGASAAVDLVDELRRARKSSPEDWPRPRYIEELKNLLRPALAKADLDPPEDGIALYLLLGVNGVGKTTTIAKMAHRFIKNNLGPVTFAAGDTFRAAAIDQLEIHANRVGARVVKQQQGADPGAVIYDAITSAKSRGERVIIADTAGRVHNRTNLVRELEKINRIARDRLGNDGTYRKILVIDATTGQNGLKQAETFHEAVGVDAVCLAKYDSSAKGGLVAAIGRKLHLPFAYLGQGEGMDDLLPFDPDAYLDELLTLEE